MRAVERYQVWCQECGMVLMDEDGRRHVRHLLDAWRVAEAHLSLNDATNGMMNSGHTVEVKAVVVWAW